MLWRDWMLHVGPGFNIQGHEVYLGHPNLSTCADQAYAVKKENSVEGT